MPITSERDYHRAVSALSSPKLSPEGKAKLEASISSYESQLTNVGAAQGEIATMDKRLPLTEMEPVAAEQEASLARPPEYHPMVEENPRTPPSLKALRENSPIDQALDAFGIVDRSHTARVRLADSVPNMIGGNAKMFEEPSRRQFEAEMVAKGINPVDLTDDDYKVYSDAKWAEVYDAARASGTPVVRISQMSNEGWADKVGKVAAQALPGVVSASSGALDAFIPGGSSYLTGSVGEAEDLDGLRATREAHPFARAGGAIAGALSPRSLLGAPARAAAAATRTAGLGTKLAAAGGAGAAMGFGTAAVGNALEDEADALVGREAQGERMSLPVAAALGGAIGAAGQGVSSAASAATKALRQSTSVGPAVNALERAGGRLTFSGPKAPADIEDNVAQAAAKRVHPLDVAAQKAEVEVADAGYVQAQRQAQAMLDQTAAAHKAMEGQTVSSGPLLDKFLDVATRRRYADTGEALPVVNVQAFDKQLARLADVKVVSEATAQEMSKGGARILGLEEAQAMGLQVSAPDTERASWPQRDADCFGRVQLEGRTTTARAPRARARRGDGCGGLPRRAGERLHAAGAGMERGRGGGPSCAGRVRAQWRARRLQRAQVSAALRPDRARANPGASRAAQGAQAAERARGFATGRSSLEYPRVRVRFRRAPWR